MGTRRTDPYSSNYSVAIPLFNILVRRCQFLSFVMWWQVDWTTSQQVTRIKDGRASCGSTLSSTGPTQVTPFHQNHLNSLWKSCGREKKIFKEESINPSLLLCFLFISSFANPFSLCEMVPILIPPKMYGTSCLGLGYPIAHCMTKATHRWESLTTHNQTQPSAFLLRRPHGQRQAAPLLLLRHHHHRRRRPVCTCQPMHWMTHAKNATAGYRTSDCARVCVCVCVCLLQYQRKIRKHTPTHMW